MATIYIEKVDKIYDYALYHPPQIERVVHNPHVVDEFTKWDGTKGFDWSGTVRYKHLDFLVESDSTLDSIPPEKWTLLLPAGCERKMAEQKRRKSNAQLDK